MRQFAFRLALKLGRWDVDALLAEMPRRAFLEWLAYHEMEPWSEDRADARAAIVSCLIYNVNRRRGAPAKRPGDFMAYRAPKRKMAPDKRALFRKIMEGLPRADSDQS